MANKTVEYETIKGTIIPKSIEESNKLITGLVEKIKNYEKGCGRKIKVEYDIYKYIPSNLEDKSANVGEVITGATVYSSNLIDILHNFKSEFDEHIIYGHIKPTFDKSSNTVSEIEVSMLYDPWSDAENFRKEYQGLVDIVKNYNKK